MNKKKQKKEKRNRKDTCKIVDRIARQKHQGNDNKEIGGSNSVRINQHIMTLTLPRQQKLFSWMLPAANLAQTEGFLSNSLGSRLPKSLPQQPPAS